jgi:GMP synthase (glutamine-hydrolysing)
LNVQDKIFILDFGSQYTQLIARRIRELNVYCEIQPCTKPIDYSSAIKGVILSGSPYSVNDEFAPKPDVLAIASKVPVLGVCYGAQLIAQSTGGVVGKSAHREYGRAHLDNIVADPLFAAIENGSQVWMSHSDSVK